MGTQAGLNSLVILLIVLCADFKIALGMVAGGADLGSLCADDDMPAVAALPDLDLALRENFSRLDIVQQGAIALLVVLLDCGDQAELAARAQGSPLPRRSWQSRRTCPSTRSSRPRRQQSGSRRCRRCPASSLNQSLACSFSFSAVLRKSAAICS